MSIYVENIGSEGEKREQLSLKEQGST